jgi:serine/threonine protein kinase
MYILLVGRHPLHKKGEEISEYTAKLKNPKWVFPKQCTELAKTFFLRLMKVNPLERYTAKEALDHPWITRVPSSIPLSYAENVAYEKMKSKMLNVFFVLLIVGYLLFLCFS